MRLAEILHQLQRPLLIKPSAHASYFQLFQDHAQKSREDFHAERTGVDYCGKAIELDQAETSC